MTEARLDRIFALIDAANGRDPNLIQVDGAASPAELAYGRRMSAELAHFRPDAGEIVRIAARGQHIERWTSPRKGYPEGRVGYLKWRKDLKDFHARRVGDLMAEAGYDQTAIARAGQLIRKEKLAQDADAQTIEDVACIVFLKYYADPFIAPHDDAKVVDILAKTARKMSASAITAAGGLPLAERLRRLLGAALATPRQTGPSHP